MFSPSDAEIFKAAKIKHAYEEAVRANRGAVGVTVAGQTLMIDAPMLKVRNHSAVNTPAMGR